MTRGSTLPQPVKRTAQVISAQGVGRATQRFRTLPTLLIAGGQRCGTTSMYRALTQHPAVFKAVLHKGVHYFDTHYDRGLPWYRAHFPLQMSVRRGARRTSSTPVILESSPYYGFHPLAGTRIGADLPGVRLLVLLRDPVERAYSAHAHELARGYETEPFERALELEDSRLAGEERRLIDDPTYVSHAHQHQAYVRRGQYIDLLTRLEQVVGREGMLVVDSHRFFSQPDQVLDEVLGFLDLPRSPDIRVERHNARPRAAISDSVGHRLDEHFIPYDERLAEWLGWTPSWRS
jgi:Sulfotransferase domain